MKTADIRALVREEVRAASVTDRTSSSDQLPAEELRALLRQELPALLTELRRDGLLSEPLTGCGLLHRGRSTSLMEGQCEACQ